MSKFTRMLFLTASIASSSLGFASVAAADVGPDPSSATITSPEDGASFEGAPASIDVVLDVFVTELGLDRVELRVDGATVATLSQAPWTFTGVSLDEGMHELVAVAIAGADENPSAPVNVVVLAGAGSETGKTKGCSVIDPTRLGGGLALTGVLVLGIAGIRRRRD